MGKYRLLDKIAVVTGASSGIGRATALAFAERGAHLVLASRNTPALEQLAAQIRSQGRQALVVTTDVSQKEHVDHMVQEAMDHFSKVDILVSNAGQYIRSPIVNLAIADLEHSMAVNFYSHVYAVMAVLPHMLKQNTGRIVFNATMDAKKGLPPDTPYVSAKFALSGFSDVLRQELRGSGVRVTSLYVGRVDTPLIENLTVPWISAKIPAEAVARAIVRAIERGSREVFMPPQVIGLYYLNVFAPGLADWAVRFFHLEGWEKEE